MKQDSIEDLKKELTTYGQILQRTSPEDAVRVKAAFNKTLQNITAIFDNLATKRVIEAYEKGRKDVVREAVAQINAQLSPTKEVQE